MNQRTKTGFATAESHGALAAATDLRRATEICAAQALRNSAETRPNHVEIVVVASGGCVRAVAVHKPTGVTATASVIDYDHAEDQSDAGRRAFEVGVLGVTLQEFEGEAEYVW